jgi:hypothetical protein
MITLFEMADETGEVAYNWKKRFPSGLGLECVHDLDDTDFLSGSVEIDPWYIIKGTVGPSHVDQMSTAIQIKTFNNPRIQDTVNITWNITTPTTEFEDDHDQIFYDDEEDGDTENA